MRIPKPTESRMWELINQTHITKERIADLTHFKSRDVNFKISLWNPQTNGVRYLKTLIYNICSSLTRENWERLCRITNRNVGNPFTIKYNGEEVCLDYIQAVYELEFMENKLGMDDLTILEIGAGYGRTCHSIMSNHQVGSYYIVDLENCLKLCHNYLRIVLDEERFSRLYFIRTDKVKSIENLHVDLCINIDSASEMDENVVQYYLDYVDKHSDYFYVKNPVGKYSDKSLDGHIDGEESVQMALSTGVLRDIIDVDDNKAVEGERRKFLEAYRPSSGWKCIGDGWAIPWSYYWQALYKRMGRNGMCWCSTSSRTRRRGGS